MLNDGSLQAGAPEFKKNERGVKPAPPHPIGIGLTIYIPKIAVGIQCPQVPIRSGFPVLCKCRPSVCLSALEVLVKLSKNRPRVT